MAPEMESGINETEAAAEATTITVASELPNF